MDATSSGYIGESGRWSKRAEKAPTGLRGAHCDDSIETNPDRASKARSCLGLSLSQIFKTGRVMSTEAAGVLLQSI